jgi:predicted dienelactone hydrolase
VSRAIDAIGRDPRFAPLLSLDRVGMYGMSAGGHTALVLAGGRWSPARLRDHCEAHIADDFAGCVGLSTRLNGDALDEAKKAIALAVIRRRLTDESWYGHVDPRIQAVVAGVPFAADFDMASLASPRVTLALVNAGRDRWLVPQFHGGAVLQACLPRCELLADLPSAGHGACSRRCRRWTPCPQPCATSSPTHPASTARRCPWWTARSPRGSRDASPRRNPRIRRTCPSPD